MPEAPPTDQPARESRTASDTPADRTFGDLLVAHLGAVRAFARDLGGGGGGADDVVQETMARAWRSRDTFVRARGTFVSWLLAIAFRVFLDLRRRAGEVHEGQDLPDAAPGAERRAAAREEAERALAALDDRQRDVLLRFHRDGASIAEIARELRLPTGTVKSLLHRARERLCRSQRTGGEP